MRFTANNYISLMFSIIDCNSALLVWLLESICDTTVLLSFSAEDQSCLRTIFPFFILYKLSVVFNSANWLRNSLFSFCSLGVRSGVTYTD